MDNNNSLQVRRERVVPVWMLLMASNQQPVHLLFRYLDSCFVLVDVQDCFHSQSCLGAGSPDQVHDGFVVPQRLPFPGQTDEGEESMFHPIPFACARRVMTDRNGYPDLICQGLEVHLPGSPPAAVTTSRIRTDQEAANRAIPPPPVHSPP